MEEDVKTHEMKFGSQVLRQVADPLELSDLSKNDQIVFNVLKCVGWATRSDLVKLCDLPRTTIYDALVRLERREVVERFYENRTTRGRPKTYFGFSKCFVDASRNH